ADTESKSDGRVRFAGCRTKESKPWLIQRGLIPLIPGMANRAPSRRVFIVLTEVRRLQANGLGRRRRGRRIRKIASPKACHQENRTAARLWRASRRQRNHGGDR